MFWLRKSYWCTLVSYFLVCSLSQALANESAAPFRGFIEMGNQHPLALYHESFGPRSASILAPGATKSTLSFYWSNTLNRKGSVYLIDAETRVLALKLRHGVTPNWQLGVRTSLVWQGRGIADSPIDRWHRWFGLPRGGRNRVENNSHAIRGPLDGDRTLNLPMESTALGDLTLCSSHKLLHQSTNDFWITLEALLRLPTAQTSSRQKSIDAGISLLASRRYARINVSGGLNYLRYFDQSLESLKYAADHYSGFLGLEYALTDQWSIFSNLRAESELVSNLGEFPDHSLYFDYGHTFPISRGLNMRLGFRENLSPSSGTTDFSFMLEGLKQF